MFNNYWRWSLIILLVALFVAFPASAQSKSVIWNRFDVDITVNRDGTFDVVEKQKIHFTGGPFTYGYRDLAKKNTEAITDIQVGDEGSVYVQSRSGQPGSFYVEDRGDSLYIKWFFAETTNAARTFYIGYKVHGGLRYYDEGDQLWWQAVYADRPAAVEASEVIVKVPAPAVIENMEAYYTTADMQLLDKQTARFVAKEAIPPGKPLEVRVQFTHGVVAGSAPVWQASADKQQISSRWRTVANVFFLLLAFMLFVLAPVGVYLIWYFWGRDPRPQIAPTYLPEPPSQLPAGIAGVLIDEKADTRDVLATIVDLARRGYLHIQELEDEDGSGYSARDFLYTKLKDPDDNLLPYEAYLLEKLFAGRKERKLSELKDNFYIYNDEIKKQLYEEVTSAGYFISNPKTTRRKWLLAGMGVLMLGGVFLCLGFPLLSWITDMGALLAFGPGLFGIGLLAISYFMPKKTQMGADEAAKWKAFRTYLKDIDQYTDLEKATELFERYLPYAIAFGVDKKYLSLWERVQNAPRPAWYGPWQGPRPYYYGSGDSSDAGTRPPGHASPAAQGQSSSSTLSNASSSMSRGLSGMSSGLSSMLSVASSTLVSRPQSSSGGSGGWSGGGWSGGGGFGGGGGGGGGGGFG